MFDRSSNIVVDCLPKVSSSKDLSWKKPLHIMYRNSHKTNPSATYNFKPLVGICLSSVLPFSCEVPRGSVLAQLLFSLYTTTLSSIINISNLGHHLYAAGAHIYISLVMPYTNCFPAQRCSLWYVSLDDRYNMSVVLVLLCVCMKHI